MSKKKISDRIGGLFAFVLGTLALLEGLKLYTYRVGEWSGDHVFPIVIGVALFAAGSILLIRPSLRTIQAASASDNDQTPSAAAIETSGRFKIAAVPGLLIGYVLLLPWAGYVAATWVAAVLLFRIIGSYGWLVSVIGAVVLTGALDLLFVEWLHTPLPAGTWSSW